MEIWSESLNERRKLDHSDIIVFRRVRASVPILEQLCYPALAVSLAGYSLIFREFQSYAAKLAGLSESQSTCVLSTQIAGVASLGSPTHFDLVTH